MEPAEAHIVFYMAKDGFHFYTALPATACLLRGQIFSSLPAVFQQLEADLDVAVAFGFGTLAFERAFGIETFIMASLTFIAIVGGFVRWCTEMQAFVGWADELIALGVITKMFRTKLVFTNDFRIAVMVGILVEGVVFEIVLHLVLFQVGIVFFAAVSRIRHHFFGQALQSSTHTFQMRDQGRSDRCSSCGHYTQQ